MAVYTFLESHDFAGKTIVLFYTHAGSGLSSTVSSINIFRRTGRLSSGNIRLQLKRMNVISFVNKLFLLTG